MPFLNIGYKQIHYTDLSPQTHTANICDNGDGDKAVDTFICTHGIGGTQNVFLPLGLLLQRHGFRCVVFDSTGAGRSAYTQIEQSVRSLSNDVLGMMDVLGVRRAVVVGEGLGSVVAAHLAAEHRDRITGAVLISPVHDNSPIVSVLEERIKQVSAHGMDAVANTVPYTEPGSHSSLATKAFIRELLLAQDAAGYISLTRVLINAEKPRYACIEVPVLVIAGEEDGLAPVEGAKRVFDELGAEGGRKMLDVKKGVGGWVCVEDGEGVLKAVLGFLEEMGTERDEERCKEADGELADWNIVLKFDNCM